MNIREATDRDATAWDAFVLTSSTGSFLQTWEWGGVQKKLGVTFWRFIVEGDDGFEAVALVLRRDLPMGRSWLYVPRLGIKGDAFHVLQERLTKLGEQEKAVFIRIDPAWEQLPHFAQTSSRLRSAGKASRGGFSFRKSEREVQPQHTLLLDLSLSEEDLLAQMKSKTRYNIRLAERKGVKVRFSQDATDVDAFLELSRGVSGRSGFSYHPDEYYRAILSELSNSSSVSAELAIAEFEGQPLAVHLMVYAGDVATYAHGASSSEHRALMAPQYLYWQTIRRAKEKGAKTYDFFGVAPPDANSDHPWAGVTRVKEGFGGSRVSYIGAYDLVLDEPMYSVFNALRRVRSFLR